MFFALQLYSCKKITRETINIDVVVMNDITKKPELREELILVERKKSLQGRKPTLMPSTFSFLRKFSAKL